MALFLVYREVFLVLQLASAKADATSKNHLLKLFTGSKRAQSESCTYRLCS